MIIKPHGRWMKAWAKRRARYCQREAATLLDPVCMWCHVNHCCPQHAPKAFGGWKIACMSVQEGHWTKILMQPDLCKLWKDRADELLPEEQV